MVLACAPIGAWMAIRNTFDNRSPRRSGHIAGSAASTILYACQDITFDRETGLHSIPQKPWVQPAPLIAARSLHAATFVLLLVLGLALQLGPWYSLGVTSVGALLFYEHRIVTAQDMSRINEAFFNVNGWISVTLFLATLAHYRFSA